MKENNISKQHAIAAINFANTRGKEETLIDLPMAMKVRAGARDAITDQKAYDQFLKPFVLEISGPSCMNEAYNRFLNEEFVPYCQKNRLYEDEMIQAFFNLQFYYPFKNEDDNSWLVSDDSRHLRLMEIVRSMPMLSMFSMEYIPSICDEYQKCISIEEDSVANSEPSPPNTKKTKCVLV